VGEEGRERNREDESHGHGQHPEEEDWFDLVGDHGHSHACQRMPRVCTQDGGPVHATCVTTLRAPGDLSPDQDEEDRERGEEHQDGRQERGEEMLDAHAQCDSDGPSEGHALRAVADNQDPGQHFRKAEEHQRHKKEHEG
jgi:hypothetical protein